MWTLLLRMAVGLGGEQGGVIYSVRGDGVLHKLELTRLELASPLHLTSCFLLAGAGVLALLLLLLPRHLLRHVWASASDLSGR